MQNLQYIIVITSGSHTEYVIYILNTFYDCYYSMFVMLLNQAVSASDDWCRWYTVKSLI